MTETRQITLFLLVLTSAVMSVGSFFVGLRTYDEYKRDNQIVGELRAQVAALKNDLKDTESALMEAARENSALKDEMKRRELEQSTETPAQVDLPGTTLVGGAL